MAAIFAAHLFRIQDRTFSLAPAGGRRDFGAAHAGLASGRRGAGGAGGSGGDSLDLFTFLRLGFAFIAVVHPFWLI